MKNYEKYADKIKEYEGDSFCSDFVMPYILESISLKSVSCGNVACDACRMLQMIWLMSEYTEPEEPEVDWSKVEVDTPILVRNIENEEWNKRYFARYEYETIYAWGTGRTSWTAYDSDDVYAWKYAKLAEQEESDE